MSPWTQRAEGRSTISMSSSPTPGPSCWGEHYTRMVLQLNLPEEGEETFALPQDHPRTRRSGTMMPTSVFLVGDSTSDYDLSTSFARDNILISVLSVVFVILVLLFTFQSVGLPILLILVIQGSIWINFSFPGLTGQPIFFMSYLIVTAIQMGANIDYAIVISSWYNELKAAMPHKQAIDPGPETWPSPPCSPRAASCRWPAFLIARITTEPSHRGHRRVPVPGHPDLHVPGHVHPAPAPAAGRRDCGADPLQPEDSRSASDSPTSGTIYVSGRVRGRVSGVIDATIHGVIHGELAAMVESGDLSQGGSKHETEE